MEHKLKGSSVLHSKLKPLYWAMLPLMLFGMNQYANAATVYWDGTDTSSGNGAPIGGTGTWNTTTTNWTNDAAGTSNQAWVAGDNANFGGTGGTVTLGTAQTVGDITFSSDGYRISSQAIFFANPVNSYTVTNIGDTATISAIVGFSGGTSPNALTKLGDGKLILTGSKNYSGVTNISAGTLEAQGLMINGNIINNGSFIYSNEANSGAFYNKSISGSGTLTKTGAGTLTLSGANTYTGATTISAGLLRASNTSALGSNSAVTVGGGSLDLTTGLSIGSLAGAGNVTLNANTLTTGGNNTSTSYSGILSGTGGLTKQGSGTQTLTGTNTYTGGTTVSGGTLQGTTTSLQGNIINNANVTFDQTTNGTYAGVMSGTGSFTQAGTGNTNLTGVNTYTGTTTINDGILSVNGSIANSSTTVNTGATLGGSGTVGNVTINSGGTFAPGNSIGTINVTGDVVFSAGSNYNVEVDAAGNSDKIIATGTATLTGATVNVQPEAGTYAATTDYTILTATGGLGGTTFGSVNSNLAFLTPTLSYDANNVLLNLTRNDISFNNIASTPNQTAVSAVLDNNTTALQSIVNNITPLTESGAQQAFDSLSGIQHTQNQAVMNKLGQQFKQLLFSRSTQSTNSQLGFNPQTFKPMQGYLLADNSNNWPIGMMEPSSLAANPRGWWMQGLGGFGTIADTTNASGSDYQSAGVALGIDTQWRDFVVGVAGSYTRSNVDPFAGDSDIESFQAGAYGSWARDNIYMNTSVNLGLHKIDATRVVTVGNSVNTATSNYDSINLGVALETGKDIKLNLDTTLTPYIGVSYSHNKRDGFIETGASTANLSVKQQDEDSLRTILGLRLSREIQTKNNETITPAASIAYVHEHLDSQSQLEAGFTAVPTSTFKVDGSDLDKNRLQIGLGVTSQLNRNTTLNVGYNGELASSDKYHSFAATVKFVW
ncbi:autotransporter domain-containing protein [Neptuniibacter sp. 2_MG-2023]|uniref:autotransporter family protein n=1 Tax=Neptuniibacter sp. 2_MG-2023 TaxID=3062671 RepID=UPI0026E23016|nr:autotransporter domain-containing protein [Neptuniibacter sp. 2_MG-2023]MDO6514573.1 autotransporter domain-containing protein [Neptuniibacter sp. 2_MG-2023]